MEALFKMTRAEVEEACAQALAQRGIAFASPPKLAEDSSQTFTHLYFHGDVAGHAPAAPAPLPLPQVQVHVPVPVAAAPVPVVPVSAPVDPFAAHVVLQTGLEASPATTPSFREGSFVSTTPVAPGEASKNLNKLFDTSMAPSTVRLPALTEEYRRQTD